MKNKGFTIIELLVVIVVIGILSTIAIPQFTNNFMQARDSERKASIRIISNIIKINQTTKDNVNYYLADRNALKIELNTQGYIIPKGIDNGLCYVYGEKADTDDEFFVAIGLEESGGPTMVVAGTPNGIDIANAITITIAGNNNENCADSVNKISALKTAENTYDYVVF